MTAASRPARHLWVFVVLIALLLSGPALDLAAASGPPPAKKQAPAKPGKKKKKSKAKKKGSDKEKKAGAKKKRKRKPRPSPKPITAYDVSAEGSFDSSVRKSESTPAAPYENKSTTVTWLATGSATVLRSGTGSTFQITGAPLHGVLTGYGFDWNWGEKRKDYDFVTEVSCADSLVETVHGAPAIPLGLSGTTAHDLHVEVGRARVPGTLVRSPSGPPICAHMTGGSFPTTLGIGPQFSLPKTLSGPGALECESGGSHTAGWHRSCSATTTTVTTSGNLSYSETSVWTMSVKLTPVRGRSA